MPTRLRSRPRRPGGSPPEAAGVKERSNATVARIASGKRSKTSQSSKRRASTGAHAPENERSFSSRLRKTSSYYDAQFAVEDRSSVPSRTGTPPKPMRTRNRLPARLRALQRRVVSGSSDQFRHRRCAFRSTHRIVPQFGPATVPLPPRSSPCGPRSQRPDPIILPSPNSAIRMGKIESADAPIRPHGIRFGQLDPACFPLEQLPQRPLLRVIRTRG